MIVTTVALPAVLHRELALAALDEHTGINELLRQAAREWLQRRKQGRRRARAKA